MRARAAADAVRAACGAAGVAGAACGADAARRDGSARRPRVSVVAERSDRPRRGGTWLRRRVPRLRHAITFEHVWFRYPAGGRWVLRGVNLEIPAQRSVLLAGRAGAGKSTVLRLLRRLHEPQHGVIRWDGIDLRRFELGALRRTLAAEVAQVDEPVDASAQAAAGRTMVVAARSLRAAAAVDLVYVVEGGRITVAGTPEVLLARGDAYARLLAAQAGCDGPAHEDARGPEAR